MGHTHKRSPPMAGGTHGGTEKSHRGTKWYKISLSEINPTAGGTGPTAGGTDPTGTKMVQDFNVGSKFSAGGTGPTAGGTGPTAGGTAERTPARAGVRSESPNPAERTK